MSNSSLCSYGSLARVYLEDDEWIDDESFSKTCFRRIRKKPYRADKDLLLALGKSYLVIFRRKSPRTRSCVCMSPSELSSKSSVEQRQASEFQCPHVHSFDDYEQWAVIEYSAIIQVQLTINNSNQNENVCAKPKDLIMVVRDSSNLWLDFEHNLNRDFFIDALKTASAPHVIIDFDCSDHDKSVEGRKGLKVSLQDGVADVSNRKTTSRMVFDFQRAASRLAVMLAVEIDDGDLDVALYGDIEHEVNLPIQTLSSAYTGPNQPISDFNFKREALRKAIENKAQLALQIASEIDLHSPQCHFILGTAMELSCVLDEPDLYTLTWLVSGFINLQRSNSSTKSSPTRLAQTQLEYAIKMARENSLRHLLALALACCSDLHRLSTRDMPTARSLLIDAAKLMPMNALNLVSKMQLHQKIHQLGITKFRPGDGERQDKNIFDLWKAMFIAMSKPAPIQSEVPTSLLLRPLVKTRTERFRRCFVQIFAVSGAGFTTGPHQILRVYLTEQLTFEWLRQEVIERCNIIPLYEHVNGKNCAASAQVLGFYDSMTKNKSIISWNADILDVVRMDWHIIRAVVMKQNLTSKTNSLSSPPVLVRCFKCRNQMHLTEVDAHSGSCQALSDTRLSNQFDT
ncbi:hypothetical protein Plhal304r1_c053g0137931 [Plasmopara halstedii]